MSAPSIAGHRNNVPKHPNVLHSYVGSPVSVLVDLLRAQMSEEDLVSLHQERWRRVIEGEEHSDRTATSYCSRR